MRLTLYILIALAVTGGALWGLRRNSAAASDEVSAAQGGSAAVPPSEVPAAPTPPVVATAEAAPVTPAPVKPVKPVAETPVKPSEMTAPPVKTAVQLLRQLSPSRLMGMFLEQDKPIEALLNAMDDVIQGTRPTASLALFMPREKYTAMASMEFPGKMTISTAAIRRFQPMVDAVTAIPPAAVAQCLREMHDDLQLAFAAGGYSYSSIDDMVQRFIGVFLTMPEFNFNPVVKPMPNGNFMYADAVFEELNDVQKLLVRLGIDNLRKLKKWFIEVRKELGR